MIEGLSRARLSVYVSVCLSASLSLSLSLSLPLCLSLSPLFPLFFLTFFFILFTHTQCCFLKIFLLDGCWSQQVRWIRRWLWMQVPLRDLLFLSLCSSSLLFPFPFPCPCPCSCPYLHLLNRRSVYYVLSSTRLHYPLNISCVLIHHRNGHFT